MFRLPQSPITCVEVTRRILAGAGKYEIITLLLFLSKLSDKGKQISSSLLIDWDQWISFFYHNHAESTIMFRLCCSCIICVIHQSATGVAINDQ